MRFDVGALAGTALIEYNRFAQRVILAGKNGGRPDVLRCLGRLLGRIYAEQAQSLQVPVTVSWVPASGRGRQDRGFDQGRILARSAASEIRSLGQSARGSVTARSLLARADRRPQMGLPRSRRLAGPELCWSGGAAPNRVFLIDDVVTTGSSLRAAIAILRDNGVTEIEVGAAATVS